MIDSPESAAIDGDHEQLEDRVTANWMETYGNETVLKSDFLTVLYPIDRFQVIRDVSPWNKKREHMRVLSAADTSCV